VGGAGDVECQMVCCRAASMLRTDVETKWLLLGSPVYCCMACHPVIAPGPDTMKPGVVPGTQPVPACMHDQHHTCVLLAQVEVHRAPSRWGRGLH
jgi:hypothetical protein